jgi:choline kinase
LDTGPKPPGGILSPRLSGEDHTHVHALPRTAILLAAGSAKRLKELTRERPKCLLDVGGKTLLEHQLSAMRSAGIDDFVIVTGYYAEAVERAAAGPGVRFVRNPIYDRTNSIYSLHLALPAVSAGFVLTNADVLFHPRLLARLLHDGAADALLMEPNRELGDEEMKVRVEGGRVRALAKDLPAGSYDGENLGVLKFSAAGAQRLRLEVGRLIDAGDVNAWAPRAFSAMCGDHEIGVVPTAGLPWIEIDFPEDLDRARRITWPRIETTLGGAGSPALETRA